MEQYGSRHQPERSDRDLHRSCPHRRWKSAAQEPFSQFASLWQQSPYDMYREACLPAHPDARLLSQWSDRSGLS